MESRENKDIGCGYSKGGPIVKSVCCSCRRPEFHLNAKNSQLLTACTSISGESDVFFWLSVVLGPHNHSWVKS